MINTGSTGNAGNTGSTGNTGNAGSTGNAGNAGGTGSGARASEREVHTAYFTLLAELLSKYGICTNVFNNSGLFAAKLIDLDNDGTDELILYYSDMDDYISGYIVYGYNKASNKAELIHDNRKHMVELYDVSIFKGQDGNLYVKNANGQSYEYFGDFSALIGKTWKTVLSWGERWDDEWEYVTFTFSDGGQMGEAEAENVFRRYEAELVFEFTLFDWENFTPLGGNINEMYEFLKP